MSTILDALKKSEQERKLNKLPTLNDMVTPQEPSRWPLVAGLALLLAMIALTVLAYFIWVYKPDAGESADSSTEVSNSKKQASGVGAASASVAGDRDSSASGSLVADNTFSADGTLSPEGSLIARGSQLAEAPVSIDSVLINAISYSKDPKLRFAMINSKVVREGELIGTGLRIEKIDSDKVVFDFRGEQITRHP